MLITQYFVTNPSQSLCLTTIDSAIGLRPATLPARLLLLLLLACTRIEKMRRKKIVEKQDLLLREERRYTACRLS